MGHADAMAKYGAKTLDLWRYSYNIGPDRGESMEDISKRVSAILEMRIIPELKQHNNVLVVCHNGSLRVLIRNIEKLSVEDVARISIEHSRPIIYEFDRDDGTFKRTNPIPTKAYDIEHSSLK